VDASPAAVRLASFLYAKLEARLRYSTNHCFR
jgi:hypothetical protein